MKVYFDTSALVKLFINEQGSFESKDTADSAELLVVSEIAWAETIAAFSGMRKIGRLSSEGLTKTLEELKDFWPSLEKVKIDWELITSAADLSLKYKLRSYDSIQLASLLRIKAVSEVSLACWDKDLANAARKEGISVLAGA